MKDSSASFPFTAGETEIYPSAYFWPEVSLEFEGSGGVGSQASLGSWGHMPR